jgi:hypothetical protein
MGRWVRRFLLLFLLTGGVFLLSLFLHNREILSYHLPLSLRIFGFTLLFFPPSGPSIRSLLLFSFLLGVSLPILFLTPLLWKLFLSQRSLKRQVQELKIRSQLKEEEKEKMPEG